MNLKGFAEDEPAPHRQHRPALYPWVRIPAPLGAIAGAGCLAAVTLSVVQALLRVTLTYGVTIPPADAAVVQVNPYSSFAAKLAVFSTNGAGLGVAVVLLVAVVVVAASGPGPDAPGLHGYSHILALSTLTLAAVVVLANAAAVEVTRQFSGRPPGHRQPEPRRRRARFPCAPGGRGGCRNLRSRQASLWPPRE